MSLSDKISSGIADSTRDDLLIIEKLPFDVIKVEDVKLAVQELKDWIKDEINQFDSTHVDVINQVINTIFGDKLTGVKI